MHIVDHSCTSINRINQSMMNWFDWFTNQKNNNNNEKKVKVRHHLLSVCVRVYVCHLIDNWIDFFSIFIFGKIKIDIFTIEYFNIIIDRLRLVGVCFHFCFVSMNPFMTWLIDWLIWWWWWWCSFLFGFLNFHFFLSEDCLTFFLSHTYIKEKDNEKKWYFISMTTMMTFYFGSHTFLSDHHQSTNQSINQSNRFKLKRIKKKIDLFDWKEKKFWIKWIESFFFFFFENISV